VVLRAAVVVRLTVVLVGSGRGVQRLEQALRSLMIPTQLKPGCVDCSTWVNPDSSVHYEETWTTEAHMRDRVASEAFTRLLAVMEASEEPPRVQFDFVTSTRGLDYVEEIRAGRPIVKPESRSNPREGL
jgi:quinol monooxygenase YgiN